MTSPVGTLLSGRYRLDAQIGHGGMSTVYRAFDTVLERQVAIKLMHREIASDSDQLERFRREARSVARLSHPHIVTVIDAGEEPSEDGAEAGVGAPYIVLEYVPGETLKQLIRREGPLAITESSEMLTRWFSRGGIAAVTAAACSDSTRSFSSSGRAKSFVA